MYENTYKDHLAALKKIKKDSSSYDAPFNEERNAAASWICNDAQTNLDDTMACILRGTLNKKRDSGNTKDKAKRVFISLPQSIEIRSA